MNDLVLENIDIITTDNTSLVGKIQFKNLFKTTSDNFKMDAYFQQVASTYTDLKALLPRVLGNTLPSDLGSLGRFDMRGTAKVSNEAIITVMDIETDIGTFL